MSYTALSRLYSEGILPGKKPIILGLSVISSLILFYVYNDKKKKNESLNEDESVIKGKQTIVEIKVPHDCVRNLIGPQGQNIKELQRRTNTRMNFKDRNNNQNEQEKNSSEWNQDNTEKEQQPERILVIRGSNTNVQRAEFEIKKILLENPVSMTQEFYVPQYACGRIIGKGGSTIKEISQSSNCRITVVDDSRFGSSQSIEKLSTSSKDSNDQTFRVVRITGSNERISFAKDLISSKIKEEEQFRDKKTKRYRY